MKGKRVGVGALLLSIVVVLTSFVSIPTVMADVVYYTWDSADNETHIYAPAGQHGSDVKSYADPSGLIRVYAKGGFGLWGTAEAWGELFKTVVLSTRKFWWRPIITYEAQGGIINGGLATITLTVSDSSTSEIVGQWSQALPISFDAPETETLTGDFFEAEPDRQYLFYVKVYAASPITWGPGAGGYITDYYKEGAHVKVKQLYIERLRH